MKPKIHDGDLCVFERYTGGSREGEVVWVLGVLRHVISD